MQGVAPVVIVYLVSSEGYDACPPQEGSLAIARLQPKTLDNNRCGGYACDNLLEIIPKLSP